MTGKRNPLVIFDCDGVLMDSEAIASAVFAEHLANVGLDYSAADCRQHFTGLSLSSCERHIADAHGIVLPEDFFSRLQAETYARFSQSLAPVPGAREVLDFLDDAGWRYCVASSGSHEKMQVTLSHTGLLPRLVNRLYSASEVARGKPAPDLFLHAAQAERYAPVDCIVIEDSAPGMQAALAAGMRVCAFVPRELAGQMKDTVAFTDMSELPAILVAMQAN
ncbi:MAG TPA: HAD-IA family hydrolase [Pseudomonadales bacterium]|nr:HAD-IA family hydrolase [Pseudomonadales bacterium]